MRWAWFAVGALACALWWAWPGEGTTGRQSRKHGDSAAEDVVRPDRQVGGEGRGEPGTRPRSTGRTAAPRDATQVSSVSFIVLRCRDERREPRAGLTVAWGYPNDVLVNAGKGRTDEQGRLTIEWPGAPGGSVLVHAYDEVRHGHEARVTAKTAATPDSAPLDLIVARPVERLVRVVDLAGRPIAGAKVHVDPVIVEKGMISAVRGGWRLRTNAVGECVVTAGRALPYRLTAVAEGFTEEYVWDWRPPEDDRPTVLKLRDSCTVTGTIPGIGPGARVEFEGPVHEAADADDEGGYRLADLPPGAYRLVILDKEKRVRAMREVTLKNDASLDPIAAEPVVAHRLEILDPSRNPARNVTVVTTPGGHVLEPDETGRVRVESAMIPGLWVIVSAAKCGSRWIAVTELESPVVLPRACTLRLHIELGEARAPELLPFAFGPPGRPPRTEILICDAAREVRLFDDLPPGPLDIDFLGQTRRVELHPDKPVDVHFRVGK